VRRSLLAFVVLVPGGCFFVPGIDDDYTLRGASTGQAGAGTGGVAGGPTSSSTSGGQGGMAGQGSGGAECSVDPPPPGQASCPSVCTGGCPMPANRCLIDCSGGNLCQDAQIVCPTGYDCEINCTGGSQRCLGIDVTCPDEYACIVDCNSGGAACQGAVIHCSAQGTCSIGCGAGNQCDGAQLLCGNDACTASCSGGSMPALTCGDSCMCTTC
jgi:hypothetical protein